MYKRQPPPRGPRFLPPAAPPAGRRGGLPPTGAEGAPAGEGRLPKKSEGRRESLLQRTGKRREKERPEIASGGEERFLPRRTSRATTRPVEATTFQANDFVSLKDHAVDGGGRRAPLSRAKPGDAPESHELGRRPGRSPERLTPPPLSRGGAAYRRLRAEGAPAGGPPRARARRQETKACVEG